MRIFENELRQAAFDGARTLMIDKETQPYEIVLECAILPALRGVLDFASKKRAEGAPIDVETELGALIRSLTPPPPEQKKVYNARLRQPSSRGRLNENFILKDVDESNPFGAIDAAEEPEEVETYA